MTRIFGSLAAAPPAGGAELGQIVIATVGGDGGDARRCSTSASATAPAG